MIEAIRTSDLGLDAAQTWLNVTGNNLANLDTTGFKTQHTNFQDLIYVSNPAPGGAVAQGLNSPVGVQIGRGVAVESTDAQFTQGVLQHTGRTLDVAINGNGFFQVGLPGGNIGYTRDGAFQTDPLGRLVTDLGFPIEPPITIPIDALSVTIAADGTVISTRAGAPTTPVVLGQLALAQFPNPGGLLLTGNNLYAQSVASGPPNVGVPGLGGAGVLSQGNLETSNVDAASQLVNLILGQFTFSANSRVITVANEMLIDTASLIP